MQHYDTPDRLPTKLYHILQKQEGVIMRIVRDTLTATGGVELSTQKCPS